MRTKSAIPFLNLNTRWGVTMCVCAICVFTVWAATLQADDENAKRSRTLAQLDVSERQASKNVQQELRKSSDTSAVEDSEQRMLKFVEVHQPKLLTLLEFLRRQQPVQYTQALKEMSRAQLRLESLAKRDQELYAVELQLWQLRSELRLLAAEMSVSKSDAASAARQRQLAELIQQEAAQELVRLQLLKVRTEKELDRLNSQIKSLSDSHPEHVEKTMKLWLNRISKQAREKTSGN